MKNSSHESASRGFTLVELLIAMLIGLVIVIGVVQIFSANRATYQLDEGLARAQENGRFSLYFLSQDIRHAGYLGCNKDTTRIPFNFLATAQQRLPVTGIAGFEYTATPTGINNTYPTATGATPANTTVGWNATLPAIVAGSNGLFGALPGTDVLIIQRMVPNTWSLVAPYVTPANVLLNPVFVNQVAVDDILLVSDCREAAVFQVTGITPAGVISHLAGVGAAPGNRCGNWVQNVNVSSGEAAAADCTNVFDSDQLPPRILLGRIETTAYYVARGPAPDFQPTLYKNSTNPSGLPNVQALVEGVESFQVLYGVDNGATSDGIADSYVTANNVTAFTQVVSVRIGVLTRSIQASGTASDNALDTTVYNVAGTNIDPVPDDRRKRRAFNTTIQLRNRGF